MRNKLCFTKSVVMDTLSTQPIETSSFSVTFIFTTWLYD